MQSALLVIHVLLSLSLIGLVLIQQGKGADAGAAFGGGASSTMFGSSGAGSFLTRLTTGLAIAFFVTSLGLAYISASEVADVSVVEEIDRQKTEEAEKSNTSSEESLSTDLPVTEQSGDLPEGQLTPSQGSQPGDLPTN